MQKNKLLIVTQKVDRADPILGFFHRWIAEFAKHFDLVSVVCLEKGDFDLLENVEVFSLGKENGKNKIKYVINFYKYIFKLRKRYDMVFIHMNPEYAVLGGIFWKMAGKKIALWYTHRQSNLKLWIAEKLCDKIFTSSRYSFTLKSKKIHIMGHGVDTEFLASIVRKPETDKKTFIHVGRISRIKNCGVLIEAANILKQKWGESNFKVQFFGDTITEQDKAYKKELISLIKKYNLENIVEFMGEVAPLDIAGYYAKASAAVNLAPTGGMDKAVIESMAAGVPTFVSNLSFAEILGEHGPTFIFNEKDAGDLAGKIHDYFLRLDTDLIEKEIKDKTKKMFEVSNFIGRIYSKLYETNK